MAAVAPREEIAGLILSPNFLRTAAGAGEASGVTVLTDLKMPSR